MYKEVKTKCKYIQKLLRHEYTDSWKVFGKFGELLLDNSGYNKHQIIEYYQKWGKLGGN